MANHKPLVTVTAFYPEVAQSAHCYTHSYRDGRQLLTLGLSFPNGDSAELACNQVHTVEDGQRCLVLALRHFGPGQQEWEKHDRQWLGLADRGSGKAVIQVATTIGDGPEGQLGLSVWGYSMPDLVPWCFQVFFRCKSDSLAKFLDFWQLHFWDPRTGDERVVSGRPGKEDYRLYRGKLSMPLYVHVTVIH